MKLPFENGTRRKGRPVEQAATAESVFISGGLKAAMNTPPAVRRKIMKDISAALECDPVELEFLFSQSPTPLNDAAVYDFPDAERRRSVIRENRLDAAE